MPSFFDHLLTISVPRIGKDEWPKTLEDFPIEYQEQYYEVRNTAYYNLLQVEFQLQYHAHISIGDQDAMSVHERRTFYELLKQQKQEEQKAMEQASHKSK